MTSPVPQPAIPKSGGYQQEANTFSSITDLFRFFQPRKFQMSTASPPSTNQVKEGEFVFDKTTLKLWTKLDGTMRFVQFT